jgi:hypothetical protein
VQFDKFDINQFKINAVAEWRGIRQQMHQMTVWGRSSMQEVFMNDSLKRIMRALKVGVFTAVLVFAGMLAPFAFVTVPMTDARIDRSYEIAGWCALAGFLFQFIRVLVFKKSKT